MACMRRSRLVFLWTIVEGQLNLSSFVGVFFLIFFVYVIIISIIIINYAIGNNTYRKCNVIMTEIMA